MPSVELTVTVEAVIKIEHDGPTEGLDSAKYDALLYGGLRDAEQHTDLKESLGECFGSGHQVDLGWVDDSVAYMATEILDATVLKVDKIERGK